MQSKSSDRSLFNITAIRKIYSLRSQFHKSNNKSLRK